MPLIIYEKKGRVAHVRLNRPEKLNALGKDIVRELAIAWLDFKEDDQLLVAILSAEGRAFSSGHDIDSLNLKDFNIEECSPLYHEIWKPVIAALHGYVLGAGLFLALDCDIRVAAEDTELGLPEIRLNMPSVRALRLPYYIPRGIVYELAFVGTRMNAERAYQIGLINRIVGKEQLLQAVQEIAEKICENGPLAIKAQKMMYERSKTMSLHDAGIIAPMIFAPAKASDDSKEAMQAFRQKRKPEWKLR